MAGLEHLIKADALPISVIIVTRGKLARFERCLEYLEYFSDVHIVHSPDGDNDGRGLRDLCAKTLSYRYYNFIWDGKYPKKRQWCLDNLPLKHDWVFMLDADEVLTKGLIEELLALRATVFTEEGRYAGCFIRGAYVMDGHILKYGLKNNKLALFKRSCFRYPVVDDLDATGMAEIEGHYQPVFMKRNRVSCKILQIKNPLVHHAFLCQTDYDIRHNKYAQWEAVMIRDKGYPKDPVLWREVLKSMYRKLPLRAEISFLHSYILKSGWRDGVGGFRLAKSRYDYYKNVSMKLRELN